MHQAWLLEVHYMWGARYTVKRHTHRTATITKCNTNREQNRSLFIADTSQSQPLHTPAHIAVQKKSKVIQDQALEGQQACLLYSIAVFWYLKRIKQWPQVHKASSNSPCDFIDRIYILADSDIQTYFPGNKLTTEFEDMEQPLIH